jgi:hypothetical protein
MYQGYIAGGPMKEELILNIIEFGTDLITLKVLFVTLITLIQSRRFNWIEAEYKQHQAARNQNDNTQ